MHISNARQVVEVAGKHLPKESKIRNQGRSRISNRDVLDGILVSAGDRLPGEVGKIVGQVFE